MQEQNQGSEQEMDLHKYLEVILKRKKLILAIFFISVTLTAVVNLMTPRAYKATATIMITPLPMQSAFSPSQRLLEIKNDETPGSIAMARHAMLLKSNSVLERIIKKLDLKGPSGKDETLESLSKRLNILDSKKALAGNMFQLEATNGKPEIAAVVANAWVEEYVNYNLELSVGEMSGIGDFVIHQYEVFKNDLLRAESEVDNFRKSYKQDLVRANALMKKNALNRYNAELANMELAIKTQTDSLAALKEQIAEQEKFIIVSKAITDDALWQASSRGEGSHGIDEKSLRSEQVNPIYQDLETRIVNASIELNTLVPRAEYLKKLTGSLAKEIREQENDIIQKDSELKQLERQATVLKKAYDLFSDKVNEARSIKAAQFGEVKIVSPAVAPSLPVSRGGLKKIILAGVSSFMCGIFLVFFMEYWQRPEKT